jgi:hypothetical protein
MNTYLTIKAVSMAYTKTISCKEETYIEFQKLCIERGTKVSTELQAFMESELSDKQKAFDSLVDQVNNLQNIVNELTGAKNKEDDF